MTSTVRKKNRISYPAFSFREAVHVMRQVFREADLGEVYIDDFYERLGTPRKSSNTTRVFRALSLYGLVEDNPGVRRNVFLTKRGRIVLKCASVGKPIPDRTIRRAILQCSALHEYPDIDRATDRWAVAEALSNYFDVSGATLARTSAVMWANQKMLRSCETEPSVEEAALADLLGV